MLDAPSASGSACGALLALVRPFASAQSRYGLLVREYVISSVGRNWFVTASLEAMVQPFPVLVLEARINQPRLVTPLRNISMSLVTSKIDGAPSTSGTRENVAALAASMSSALTPFTRTSHVAVSFHSTSMRCARNVSLES